MNELRPLCRHAEAQPSAPDEMQRLTLRISRKSGTLLATLRLDASRETAGEDRGEAPGLRLRASDVEDATTKPIGAHERQQVPALLGCSGR